MHRSFATFIYGACVAVLLTGCSQHETVLGKAPVATLSAVSTAQHTPISKPIALQGVMVEKCPIAGCWFIMRDKTGTIKVDTKAAGFTVVNVPLQTKVTVTGRMAQNGSEKIVAASGLRY